MIHGPAGPCSFRSMDWSEMTHPDNSAKAVHVLQVGPFGNGIAEYLTALRGDVVVTSVTNDILPLPDVWPVSRMMVVASWRQAPTLCELVDELSHKWQRPFIPLILDSTEMRIGPVVVPGSGCCWRCWMRRQRQHASWPEARVALQEHYANHPQSGPKGYLEPFARMGAARLSAIIDDMDAEIDLAGTIWQIDTLTRRITTSMAVGVHGCPQCGMQRPEAARSVAALQSDLAYLWRQTGGEGPER